MRKIINDKMYNTETATRIACWDNDTSRNDLYYYSEELYQKKTKEFFLYYECGAASMVRNKISPITENDAKEWLSKRDHIDEYIKLFGEPEE